MFCPFCAFQWGLEQVFKDGSRSLLTKKHGCLFSTGRGVTEDTHVAGQVFLPAHLGVVPCQLSVMIFGQTSDGASVNY